MGSFWCVFLGIGPRLEKAAEQMFYLEGARSGLGNPLLLEAVHIERGKGEG